MSNKITDEKFDAIMRVLISDAAAGEEEIDAIADSPAVWWGIQRQIADRSTAKASIWPPVAKIWRLLAVGVPVLAAAAIVVSMFVVRPVSTSTDQAAVPVHIAKTAAIPEIPANRASVATTPNTDPAAVAPRHATQRRESRPTVASIRKDQVKVPATAKSELKSEFIALAYARDAESGQIVRVKVPSSMMVTLGLVATVQKPTALVDAEVIVGDDGLTRAIRFIR